MTLGDFKQIAKLLKTTYPNENFLADEIALKTWYNYLGDLPFEVLKVAVHQYTLSNRFQPSIADLRKLAVQIVEGESDDWSVAWSEVVQAMRTYGSYRGSEALASMKPRTAQAVKRMGWKEICMSENLAVERANFRMIYEQVSEKEQQQAVLPNAVREMINQITGNELKRIGEINE